MKVQLVLGGFVVALLLAIVLPMATFFWIPLALLAIAVVPMLAVVGISSVVIAVVRSIGGEDVPAATVQSPIYSR